MPKYGAYSRDIVLARPDRRSREGRLLTQARDALFGQLGGETNITPAQRFLVERASMLQLRVATLDRKIIDGSFSEYDSKTYLAFSNSLTRTLRTLGLEPATAEVARRESLADILREAAAAE